MPMTCPIILRIDVGMHIRCGLTYNGLPLSIFPIGVIGGFVSPNASQLSALSGLFSPAVFREIARKGHSALCARLFAQAGVECSVRDTVGDAFDTAFSVLRRSGFRNEYVYRAALTQNILLGTHSLKSACMLTEFRAGSCKADLAILNGTATVYEIKSERDSLSRLSNQLENYKKVFAKIYVIAGENHIETILQSTPVNVGVMCLNRRNQITRIRDASDGASTVCPVAIFESLRSDEAREILSSLGIFTPDVPNTILRRVMRDAFVGLDPESTHNAMVKTLKRSRSLAPLAVFVERLPQSLRSAALTTQVRCADQERLVEALKTPFSVAMEWN